MLPFRRQAEYQSGWSYSYWNNDSKQCLDGKESARIATALSIFNHLQNCLEREQLLQTGIENPRESAVLSVSSHGDNEGLH
ncbi:hypothetical protein B0G69_3361 [Paraburkholderia sp. RAU2J]|nr:hypothetical protein B0G69_3361 [Paraburkholderia sp. RAU2J]